MNHEQVRPEEAGIVLFVFGIWLAAIALFFNRWIQPILYYIFPPAVLFNMLKRKSIWLAAMLSSLTGGCCSQLFSLFLLLQMANVQQVGTAKLFPFDTFIGISINYPNKV